ncbi:hypothetical protein ACFVYD_26955 [Streptomyces sp. NPDC058301]
MPVPAPVTTTARDAVVADVGVEVVMVFMRSWSNPAASGQVKEGAP